MKNILTIKVFAVAVLCTTLCAAWVKAESAKTDGEKQKIAKKENKKQESAKPEITTPAKAKTDASKPESPKPFQSTKGYSITPQAGWKVNPDSVMGCEVIFLAAPEKSFSANLNVGVFKMTADETLDNDMAKINAAMPALMTGYKKLSQKLTKLDGLEGLETITNYSNGTPSVKMWMKQTLVLRKGQAFTFTCTALDENHKKYEKSFDTMMNSVRWTK